MDIFPLSPYKTLKGVNLYPWSRAFCYRTENIWFWLKPGYVPRGFIQGPDWKALYPSGPTSDALQSRSRSVVTLNTRLLSPLLPWHLVLGVLCTSIWLHILSWKDFKKKVRNMRKYIKSNIGSPWIINYGLHIKNKIGGKEVAINSWIHTPQFYQFVHQDT